MRRFSISELDARAPELALGRGLGLEIIGFCTAEHMEDEALLASEEVRLRPFARKSLHAPYYELTPCAIDSLIGRVSLHRYRQAVQTCMRLGIRRLVVHSGYAPQMYFPEWFVPRSIEFWREFVRELPPDFELLLENVLDLRPEYIRDVCDGVDDPRLRICLDVGHANAYSEVPVEEWIAMLGGRVAHVHLHNNDGSRDAHAPLHAGSMDIPHILELLDEHAPEAEICIESVDALSCLKILEETGAMEK